MIGHVEGVEAGGRIVGQRSRTLLRVERTAVAFHVGHLPQAGDDARDLQSRRELRALWAAHFGNFAWTAITSSIDIWPTVTTSPLVMRQVRKGPTMSPFLSNCTAPMTPT